MGGFLHYMHQSISIHAPRTGSDLPPMQTCGISRIFQSTLPARGATRALRLRMQPDGHFNPRSPHGERLGSSPRADKTSYFNPRSPHGERRDAGAKNPARCRFQSTLPARGATVRAFPSVLHPDHFNPRSPHGERPGSCRFTSHNRDFNPRSPHGERRRRWREKSCKM